MKTWLEHMETLGRDDRTLDRYRELLELYALPTVGGMQLKTLQPPHLSDLYAKLLREGRRDGKAGGLHPRTVGHVHRALHRMLKQGARWQLIARSPAADLELPSVPKSEMVTLTREQAGRLLKAAEPRPLMRHLVMLGVATGARLGELLALCWTDIDLEAGTVRIGWSVAVCGQHPRDRADPLLQRHQPRARHPPGPGPRPARRHDRRRPTRPVQVARPCHHPTRTKRAATRGGDRSHGAGPQPGRQPGARSGPVAPQGRPRPRAAAVRAGRASMPGRPPAGRPCRRPRTPRPPRAAAAPGPPRGQPGVAGRVLRGGARGQMAHPRAGPRGRAGAARMVAGAGRTTGHGQGWPRLGPRGWADGGVPAALEGR